VTDPLILHHGSGFINRCFLPTTGDLRSHDVGDKGFVRVAFFSHHATQHVSFRKNTVHSAVIGDHKRADFVSIHQFGRLEYRGVFTD